MSTWPEATMDLVCSEIGAVRVLAVQGRIDHAAAAGFQEALAPYLSACGPEGYALLLDFAGVEYVSSVGLRVLMLAAKQVKAQNGRIAIAALTPLVSEVFQISRFDLVFSVFDTLDLALVTLAS